MREKKWYLLVVLYCIDKWATNSAGSFPRDKLCKYVAVNDFNSINKFCEGQQKSTKPVRKINEMMTAILL